MKMATLTDITLKVRITKNDDLMNPFENRSNGLAEDLNLKHSLLFIPKIAQNKHYVITLIEATFTLMQNKAPTRR